MKKNLITKTNNYKTIIGISIYTNKSKQKLDLSNLKIIPHKEILIANIQGSYFATGNICTHEGAELHEGELHDKQLICPWHGARWDLTTGQLIWFQELLESIGSYRIVIEGDTLFVDI